MSLWGWNLACFAELLHLCGGAEHMDGAPLQLQHPARYSVVQHVLDHTRDVVLLVAVLVKLGAAIAKHFIAVAFQLLAVPKAIAARVCVVGDLDLLLDLLHIVSALLRPHVAIDRLRSLVLENKGAIGPCSSDRAILAHNIGSVEGISVAENARPIGLERLTKSLKPYEDSLGSSLCGTSEVHKLAGGVSWQNNLLHEATHAHEVRIEHDDQSILLGQAQTVKHPQDHLLAQYTYEGLWACVALLLESSPQTSKRNDDIHLSLVCRASLKPGCWLVGCGQMVDPLQIYF
mmetsp:Transcript_67548/g.162166  ORF Transcript_67548/g.162166 Transcript_67548/m.162166 type:complete len:289 (+) Transcript_67548:695-1561(+)